MFSYEKIQVFYIILTCIKNSMGVDMQDFSRIAGGSIVNDISDFPYMASVQKISIEHFFFYDSYKVEEHICSGSVVHPKLILTAAHCVVNADTKKVEAASKFTINVGSILSVTGGQTSQTSKVSKIIPHPNLDIQKRIFNIAVLVLESKLIFNDVVSPIRLAAPNMFQEKEPSESYSKGDCIVSGWGVTNETRSTTEKRLRSVALPLLKNNLCATVRSRDILDTEICTLDVQGWRDICHGDAGSPLVCKGIGIGIASWQNHCARNDSPTIWIRADKFANWMKSVIDYTNKIYSIDDCECKCPGFSGGYHLKFNLLNIQYTLLLLLLLFLGH